MWHLPWNVCAQEFEGWASLLGRHNLYLNWGWAWRLFSAHALSYQYSVGCTATIQQSHVLTEIKKEQCSVLKVLTSANPLQVRDIRPSILLALETILCSWIFQDNLLSTSRPKSLNSETTSRCFIHTLDILITLHFLMLKSILFNLLQDQRLLRSS